MKHSEVLSRYVNTGKHIPEKQYERLTTVLKKSYIRMRGISGYERWEFKILNDDEKINFIEKNGTERLIYDDKTYLYQFSKNKDYYISKVIDILGEELNEYDIGILVEYSDNKDDIITKILETKGEELSDYDVYELIHYSDEIAIKYIENKGEELSHYDIETLLGSAKNNINHIAKKIIQAKGKKLDSYDINLLLNDYGNNYNIDEIITKIIETQGIQLSNRDIYRLLFLSKEKDKNALKIIQEKGEKLEEKDIVNLFQFSVNKELIKKTLLQNGVDYNLINLVIGFNNFHVKKIPDNYQSMLQEIRRIKEIMK